MRVCVIQGVFLSCLCLSMSIYANVCVCVCVRRVCRHVRTCMQIFKLYVFMYLFYMYACRYVSVLYVCMHGCMYLLYMHGVFSYLFSTYARIYVCMYMCIYCLSMHLCMHVCIFQYAFINAYMHYYTQAPSMAFPSAPPGSACRGFDAVSAPSLLPHFLPRASLISALSLLLPARCLRFIRSIFPAISCLSIRTT